MKEKEFLEGIQEGRISIEEGLDYLKKWPYEDLGSVKLDHHREIRRGAGEVVFCQGKTDGDLAKIFQSFIERGTNILGTRASQAQFDYLKERFDDLFFDPRAGIVSWQKEKTPQRGSVVVATGGTTDIPRAEEAALTAEFFGAKVTRLYDVGVAGIHRLLDQREILGSANAVVAVAGMEGALASVIGGLVAVPVIALPTSVGYGASFKGVAALLSMLNSCSEGVTVVNIDNGFGAGYSAAQINRMVISRD